MRTKSVTFYDKSDEEHETLQLETYDDGDVVFTQSKDSSAHGIRCALLNRGQAQKLYETLRQHLGIAAPETPTLWTEET